MSSRWTGFFIWALVAACTAFWGLKIFAATHPVPSNAREPSKPVAVAGPMVRLFGAASAPEEDDAAPSPTSDRFQLVGVIAPRAGTTARAGMAIVSVDNLPAKAFHVGGVVEGDTSLLAVAKRSAQFGPNGGPTAFTLQLPEPAPPETGTLPPPVSQPQAVAPQPVAQPAQPGNLRQNPTQRPNAPYPGRPGLPVNPNMRLGGVPGQGAVMPPGRTPPTFGAQPAQPPAQQQQHEANEPADE